MPYIYLVTLKVPPSDIAVATSSVDSTPVVGSVVVTAVEQDPSATYCPLMMVSVAVPLNTMIRPETVVMVMTKALSLNVVDSVVTVPPPVQP